MELLADPIKDRVVKSVKPPPHRPLARHLMFSDKLKGLPDWKVIKDHLQKEGRIAKEDLVKLITEANKIFKNEGNLLYAQDPLVVVGDIHGQYYDFLKLLDVSGNPETTKYLFLGDYVDRGSFSIEVVILLYSLKLRYPETILLLRGNHECRQMTSFFNFRQECLHKYDQEIYDLLMDSFDLMPLACVVNGKFFAVHGGLSPELKTLDDINKLDRYKEPPKQGLYCDLLWADPVENDTGACDNVFKVNNVRGCSYFYGSEAVSKFLERNNLLSLVRAHEAQIEGYKMHAWDGKADFPLVITIFSAPNYCDVYNNKGAVIKFSNNTLNIQQFNFSTHPYTLPNFMDVFTWSVPFVSEKITEMLYNIIHPDEFEDDVSQDEEDDDASLEVPEVRINGDDSVETLVPVTKLQKRSEILRNKVKFISKMARFTKTLREQNETIIQLKHVAPDNKIPTGLLSKGEDALQDVLMTFAMAKSADLVNEKRPDN